MSDFELLSGGSSPRSASSVETPGSLRPGNAPMARTAAPSSDAPAGAGAGRFKAKLAKRHITTPVNLLVCGASGTGKSSFIRACTRVLCPASEAPTAPAGDANSSDDPHAVLVAGPDDYTTVVDGIMADEAGRELVFKFQDCPGHACMLDTSAYAEALLRFVLQQQEADYNKLYGSRGQSKDLACGSLKHSITAALYFLPPHGGPSKLDLVLMAALSRHVPLVPVVGKADTMTQDEVLACCEAVCPLLERPGEAVPGMIGPIRAHAFGGSGGQPLLLHTRDNKACTKLVELLAGNEVYGLLDAAWDKYVAFCGSYEAAGKCLKTLVGNALETTLEPGIPSLTTITGLKEQLTQSKARNKELAISLDNVMHEADDVKAKLRGANAKLGDAFGQLRDAKDKLTRETAVVKALYEAACKMRGYTGNQYPWRAVLGSYLTSPATVVERLDIVLKK